MSLNPRVKRTLSINPSPFDCVMWALEEKGWCSEGVSTNAIRSRIYARWPKDNSEIKTFNEKLADAIKCGLYTGQIIRMSGRGAWGKFNKSPEKQASGADTSPSSHESRQTQASKSRTKKPNRSRSRSKSKKTAPSSSKSKKIAPSRSKSKKTD